MSEAIWRWSATRIAAAIRSRGISAREALDSCTSRMAAVNGKLNAITVDLSERARAAADRADRAVGQASADSPLGPLHGVPVTIKENVDQQGCATTNGVVAFRDLIAPADCPAVANLKRAGAIIIGRTNTPAFSFRIDTVNDLRGRTYSPWSKTHTPGGSSGGAASSVAAGITPLAHGTDIAGSIRFPAYACGIAGIRPSFGRVPSYNPTQAAERSLSSQLMSVQGPLARTIADLRLGLGAMAARDARDPWWVPAPLDGPAPPPPIRVAVVTAAADLAGATLHPHVSAGIAQAARWLADAGYEIVDERTPGFTRAQQLWFEMQLPELREYMLPAIEQEGDEG
ncbi:MAG: amidase, partial [Burkholderiales bacterium]